MNAFFVPDFVTAIAHKSFYVKLGFLFKNYPESQTQDSSQPFLFLLNTTDSWEEKEKVYYFIDMALSHHKAKKAFAK